MGKNVVKDNNNKAEIKNPPDAVVSDEANVNINDSEYDSEILTGSGSGNVSGSDERIKLKKEDDGLLKKS